MDDQTDGLKGERDRLLQVDFQRAIRDELGAGSWVTVCDFRSDGPAAFCAVLPASERDRVMSTSGWDLHHGGVEMFCDEPDCDCRRVFLCLLSSSRSPNPRGACGSST